MHRILFAALFCAFSLACFAQTATNGNTTVYVVAVGGSDPAGIYRGITQPPGYFVASCDQRSDVVGFRVHLTGATEDGRPVDQSQTTQDEKNQSGCAVLWFYVGKLASKQIAVDPLFAKPGGSVTVGAAQ